MSPGWTPTQKRLTLLYATFGFESCMVEGCDYNHTYDVHRFIQGRAGGKYEIGNMFAICPNHHAEIDRHVVIAQKVDDHTLRIVEKQ